MEKQVLKKEEKTIVNGYIVSVQWPGSHPKQAFVETPSGLAEAIASILDSTPYAILMVQASVNL